MTTTLDFVDDAAPVDLSTLSDDQRRNVAEQMAALDKQCLRAAALHERLAAHGLAREADVLNVRFLISNIGDAAARLDAIERIVAHLESGAMPDLLTALRHGAGIDAALQLLASVQDPENAAGFGERVAVAVICGDDDGALIDDSDDVRGAIEIAERSLESRLGIIREALLLLDEKAGRPGTPLQ